MTNPPEAWLPKTREDWVGAFADGIALDRTRKDEADAKAAAEADANKDKGKDGGTGDSSPKPTWAERILGITK